MNYKLCKLLEYAQNLIKILTKYIFNSNNFSLFSCFSNILEGCKCARMSFHCANGLVVLRSFALLEPGAGPAVSLREQWTWLFCSVSVCVISANKLLLQELTQLIRIKNADFTFSRNFCFLVPFSRGGANARFALPSSDAHACQYDSTVARNFSIGGLEIQK